jgi:hypothetical protein
MSLQPRYLDAFGRLSFGPRVPYRSGRNIRCLADCDRHLLNDRIWIVRQLQKVRCLRGEGFADREGILIRATPIRRGATAPIVGLRIEVIDIGKLAAGKEA